MKFNKDEHQKVRYEGQLYAVILHEFPDYYEQGVDYPVVLHPTANNWIVQITNPLMRSMLTVSKGSSTEVSPDVME